MTKRQKEIIIENSNMVRNQVLSAISHQKAMKL
jgi:hypothetical protein